MIFTPRCFDVMYCTSFHFAAHMRVRYALERDTESADLVTTRPPLAISSRDHFPLHNRSADRLTPSHVVTHASLTLTKLTPTELSLTELTLADSLALSDAAWCSLAHLRVRGQRRQ